MNLSKIIKEVEAELSIEYRSDCFAWADNHKKGMFSGIIDRFEAILIRYENKTASEEMVQHAAELYKSEMLDMFRLYKEYKNISDADDFLNTIKDSVVVYDQSASKAAQQQLDEQLLLQSDQPF